MSTDTEHHDQEQAEGTAAPATTTRTVVHALFDYWRTNGHGRRYQATALRGDRIEVEPADLERGERLGALIDGDLPNAATPVPAQPVTPEVAGGSDPAQAPASDSGLDVDPAVAQHSGGHELPARPKHVAQKHVWVDYAVARGMPRDEAEDLTKEQIIEKYPPE